MSLTDKLSLCICKTNCYKCGKEYTAVYEKRIIGDDINISSPHSSDDIKNLAIENGAKIETLYYEKQYDVNTYTVNVCPYCGAPFGESHIKELVGKEYKEIVLIPRKNQ